MLDNDRFAFFQRSQVQPKRRRALDRAACLSQRTGHRERLKGAYLRIEGFNAGQRGTQIFYHRFAAAVHDRFKGIPPGQRQADFGAESRQSRLLESRRRGGPFSLQRVADAAFQRIGLKMGFDQVIGRSGLHRLQVNLMLPGAR